MLFSGLIPREGINVNDNLKAPLSPTDFRPPEQLDGPMLSFDLRTEIERLQKENVGQGGRNAKTLAKYPDFRVVLMVMKANAQFREHKAAGRISVEVVSGHIQMHILGKIVDLPAGHMLVLDRAVLHDVEAREESAFLLTIACPEGAANS